MSKWREILVIPDTHCPYHHRRAFGSMVDYLSATVPDEVLILGDFLDVKAPARWSRGTADEFVSNLQDEADEGVKLLGMLREVHDGPLNFIEGNHEARLRMYESRVAVAYKSLRATKIDELLNFRDLEVSYRTQPFAIAPGTVAIHGDKLAPFGGGSAMKMVRTLGKSVVQGHSHRAGVIWEATDRERFGMEAGHLADIRKAHYLSLGVANWQMAFGVLHVKGSKVIPEVIPISPDGSFYANGDEWSSK